MRRLENAVELVVVGAGPAPQLQQTAWPNGWQGQLTTASPTGLRVGPQRLSMPELGFQSVSLDGSGSSYSLSVTSMPGVPLARPVVSADGVNLILTFPASPQVSLQTNRLDLSQPGAVPLPIYAPPLQARAVAPPLGDMAVGTMRIANRGYVNLSGPRVTLTVRTANARDVLMTLARIGGYGFAFQESLVPKEVEQKTGDVDRLNSPNTNTERTEKTVEGVLAAIPPVTASFVNEVYAQAFNTVLLASGLQARKEGNTVIVGKNVLSKTMGSQASKIYRLNQVSAGSAADYLANLGASVTKTNTITTAVTQGGSQSQPSGAPNSATTLSSTQTAVEAYGASSGPLIGLLATTDSRLGTITLVGDPFVVAIAEQYLRQLDLRQRQVSLAVKIYDVSLDNDTTAESSFAWTGRNFIIANENGSLSASYGDGVTPSGAGNNSFLSTLNAQIVSSNSKLLASPTLILSENPSDLRSDDEAAAAIASSGGQATADTADINAPIGRRKANEALVRVGTNVPVSVSSTESGDTGTVSCSIDEFQTAGLVLGARVERIDDNGFVTFTLSPSVSAVVDTVEAGGNCPSISILSVRRLDTGAVRVRDGQTLILTGVISDFDRIEVSKWPVLGDIPLIGQFFRSSGNKREKRELVITVTPRIINDGTGGVYGYGYNPTSKGAQEFMASPGF
ncbi:type II secretion system protein GspD [Cyanobium sp. Aljojuca 7D2]|uniref:type II secretion system protein GspD n=1 Tax=Cyanobium sp. Aljojuca 7D2 TaxID=2823698 RepID=UPI0020CC5064|nr:general secretion pathway protein D [Cyanobium sp. Aljojuca 7D2]